MSKTTQVVNYFEPSGAYISILSGLPWPAILIDNQGRIIFQNEYAVASQEVPENTQASSLKELHPSRYNALDGSPPWLHPQKVTLTRTIGVHTVHECLWLKPIGDECSYLIVEDVTAQQTNDRVNAQTNRLASIGFMLAGVCHEVSNPLAATYSMVQLLQSQDKLTEAMFRTGLDKIAVNVKRILEVSRTVYEFSRVEDHRPLPIDLAIEQAIELLRSDLKFKNLKTFHKPDHQAVIQGDLIHLRQVFFNLGLNAAQITEGRGELKLTTFRQVPDTIVVLVEDSGPGVPPELMDKIFEPFFTTKRSGEGAGLGLAICRDIVQEHAGSISVENTADGGACFRLTFAAEVNKT